MEKIQDMTLKLIYNDYNSTYEDLLDNLDYLH